MIRDFFVNPAVWKMEMENIIWSLKFFLTNWNTPAVFLRISASWETTYLLFS